MKNIIAMKVIPDTVLETLTCKLCYKYLTVTPIGVHPDGGNICGRCLYGTTLSSSTSLFECRGNLNSENFIPLSLLGYATYPEILFPCVNRFEGCNQLMPFSTVRNHEKTCIYRKYRCPLCHFEGVGTQLVQHFKGHKRYLSSEHPVFVLDFDGGLCETYLYRLENILCLVKLQFLKDISQFVVDTSCLSSNEEKVAKIMLAFRVPAGGVSACEEYVLLSKRLLISQHQTFNMTFKISDLRLCEAKKIVCVYKIVYVE